MEAKMSSVNFLFSVHFLGLIRISLFYHHSQCERLTRSHSKQPRLINFEGNYQWQRGQCDYPTLMLFSIYVFFLCFCTRLWPLLLWKHPSTPISFQIWLTLASLQSVLINAIHSLEGCYIIEHDSVPSACKGSIFLIADSDGTLVGWHGHCAWLPPGYAQLQFNYVFSFLTVLSYQPPFHLSLPIYTSL